MPIINTPYFSYDSDEIDAIFPPETVETFMINTLTILSACIPELLPPPPLIWLLNMPEMVAEIEKIFPSNFEYIEMTINDFDPLDLPQPNNKIMAHYKLEDQPITYNYFESMKASSMSYYKLFRTLGGTTQSFLQHFKLQAEKIIQVDNDWYYILNETAKKYECVPLNSNYTYFDCPITNQHIVIKKFNPYKEGQVLPHKSNYFSTNIRKFWKKDVKQFYNKSIDYERNFPWVFLQINIQKTDFNI